MLPRSFTARARKGELRMRKFLLLFAGALTLLLSGCSTSEIGERAIIQAAAVDYDGEYIVSALLFSSGGGSGELVNAADENVIKVTGRGSTFSEAVDDISLVDGKEIFMSENRLLILGAGFVETDFTPALETLSRDRRCSLNMLVCTADDPEILTDLHFKEGLTAAEKPVSMIENAYSSGSSPRAYLLDLLNDAAAGRETLLPRFRGTQNGYGMTDGDSGETAELYGSRFLSGGRLSAPLDPEETAGALLVTGESGRTLLNFTHAGRELGCEAYSVKLTEEDGGYVLSAKLRRRDGSRLPEELKDAAMSKLYSIVRAGLDALG